MKTAGIVLTVVLSAQALPAPAQVDGYDEAQSAVAQARQRAQTLEAQRRAQAALSEDPRQCRAQYPDQPGVYQGSTNWCSIGAAVNYLQDRFHVQIDLCRAASLVFHDDCCAWGRAACANRSASVQQVYAALGMGGPGAQSFGVWHFTPAQKSESYFTPNTRQAMEAALSQGRPVTLTFAGADRACPAHAVRLESFGPNGEVCVSDSQSGDKHRCVDPAHYWIYTCGPTDAHVVAVDTGSDYRIPRQ